MSEIPAAAPPNRASRTRRTPAILRPLKAFLETEAAGGILLLAAAVVALVWANSPWAESYERLWHTEFDVRIGTWSISLDLRHWINDGLMALFFFVVGLEIKRELVTGELRDPRAAALPVFGALGGMIVPAALYAAINAGGPGSRGWGIPMATDIAFAVGVLVIAGRRTPTGLKLFLLSLAIVDDIGAILVIALFYAEGPSLGALAVAAGLAGAIVACRRLQVRAVAVYVALGFGMWLAVFESGVHASIAGVALGLLTPARPFQHPGYVSDEARRVAAETVDDPTPSDADAHHWLALAALSREAVSPLDRLERLLHPWSSFLIIPLFALANAGVDLGAGASLRSRVALGVIVGLVVGKTLGISGAAWIAVRMGWARLPQGVRWDYLFAVAAVAGIGFTVSLFVAGLAFQDPHTLASAKLGILAASLTAGALGGVLLALASRRSRRSPREEG